MMCGSTFRAVNISHRDPPVGGAKSLRWSHPLARPYDREQSVSSTSGIPSPVPSESDIAHLKGNEYAA